MARRDETWQDIRTRNEARCGRILDAGGEALVLDDLDWDAVGDVRLEPAVLDTLVYMRDVEGFVDRDLVGLTAHPTTLADPLIARFLGQWRTEEAGHAAAIGSFLDHYGAARSVSFPPQQPPPPPRDSWGERVVLRTGGPVGNVVAAAHMAWGAANELLTLNGYRLLADRSRHPVLIELAKRIAAQEARHFSFYLLQAEWRLAASRVTRFALRQVLSKSWTPVGIGDGYKTPDEFARVLAFLASESDGRRTLDRMDRRFSALPGFAGLRIFRSSAETLTGEGGLAAAA